LTYSSSNESETVLTHILAEQFSFSLINKAEKIISIISQRIDSTTPVQTYFLIQFKDNSNFIKFFSSFPSLPPPDSTKLFWTNPELSEPLPFLSSHSTILLDNFIYSFGGSTKKKFTNKFFKIIINDWKVEFLNITGPSQRSGHSLTVCNDRIYLFGGFFNGKY
jgi:hypothetical protein